MHASLNSGLGDDVVTTQGRGAPFGVALTYEGHNGHLLLDQLRAVDVTGFVERSSDLDRGVLVETLERLRETFAL